MKRRDSIAGFIAIGLLLAVLLAILVSPHASSSPDGLVKVAADKGLDGNAGDHAPASGPLADYAVAGIDNDGLSTGVAGIIGVTVTFGAALGVTRLTKARRTRPLVDHTAA
jgi:hypothetical protein